MVYIHIPFCRSFCTYCGFYSEILRRNGCESLGDGFVEALLAEIRGRADEIGTNPNTIYIGGGTPSVLPPTVYARVLDVLSEAGCRAPFDEFTVEVNPEDIVAGGEKYAEALLALGVNRISMGVQSFDDRVLRWMNRRHDAAKARQAWSILHKAGFRNISIDLIFGYDTASVPGMETVDATAFWRCSLEQALDISGDGSLPPHISAYQLSCEPGSALEKLIVRGRYQEASEEMCRTQYDIMCDVFRKAGYHHYEVSNFALEGMEAIHNSAYWSYVPYVGFGPGAHSFSMSGDRPVRRWNNPDLQEYIGNPVSSYGCETLDASQERMEKIMLALRTDKGIAEDYLLSDASCMSACRRMMDAGLLVPCGGGRLRIPENQFFISDSIISGLV
ncbi:MAG: coproporphyrinogen-III oxidase family protein [Candidatus Cryptobacteroides sp.]